jgi:hypothetical protein
MVRSKNVDSWLYEHDPYLRNIASSLREIVLEEGPGLKESVKWGNPIYEGRRRVIYLSATEDYVTLGFFSGANLRDAFNRMEPSGRRMRRFRVRALEDIDESQVRAWIKEVLVADSLGE